MYIHMVSVYINRANKGLVAMGWLLWKQKILWKKKHSVFVLLSQCTVRNMKFRLDTMTLLLKLVYFIK